MSHKRTGSENYREHLTGFTNHPRSKKSYGKIEITFLKKKTILDPWCVRVYMYLYHAS